MSWAPSPSPTVWRKRIEHHGPAEAGRVTSVVRYDPQSSFHRHPHPEGEEILVLEGVFSDEHGDYPAGTHLLNPEGFQHAPRSTRGCVLFVKLRQYGGQGRPKLATRTDDPADYVPHPEIEGVEVLELYRGGEPEERVRMLRVAAGLELASRKYPEGVELFVVAGSFADEHGAYGTGTWMKLPPGAGHSPDRQALAHIGAASQSSRHVAIADARRVDDSMLCR